MSAQTCTAETWRGMTCYPCGRPVKDEGLCGPHLRGKRASERAAALRKAKFTAAQGSLARARAAVARLAKTGVTASTRGWMDPPVQVVLTIEDAEQLAERIERMGATLARAEASLDRAATDLLRTLAAEEVV